MDRHRAAIGVFDCRISGHHRRFVHVGHGDGDGQFGPGGADDVSLTGLQRYLIDVVEVVVGGVLVVGWIVEGQEGAAGAEADIVAVGPRQSIQLAVVALRVGGREGAEIVRAVLRERERRVSGPHRRLANGDADGQGAGQAAVGGLHRDQVFVVAVLVVGIRVVGGLLETQVAVGVDAEVAAVVARHAPGGDGIAVRVVSRVGVDRHRAAIGVFDCRISGHHRRIVLVGDSDPDGQGAGQAAVGGLHRDQVFVVAVLVVGIRVVGGLLETQVAVGVDAEVAAVVARHAPGGDGIAVRVVSREGGHRRRGVLRKVDCRISGHHRRIVLVGDVDGNRQIFVIERALGYHHHLVLVIAVGVVGILVVGHGNEGQVAIAVLGATTGDTEVAAVVA